MAKVLTSISLDAPASPVSAAPTDTFAFSGTPAFTGSGGVQRYDFRWEVNDGGGWVAIAASGTGLVTPGTNPVVNTNSQVQQSVTVTCDAPGSYTIRMAGAPVSGGAYTVLSATQTVEVSSGPEFHQGSGSSSNGHSTSASGQKTGAGSAAASNAGATSAQGTKAAGGSASASGASEASAQGAKSGAGSASVSHGHTATASGSVGGGEFHQGSGAASHGHTVAAQGTKAAADLAAVSHGHSVAATGQKGGIGSAAASGASVATAGGSKHVAGSGSLEAPHTAAALGAKMAIGSASVEQSHDVVATGSSPGHGSAVASHGHAVSAAGRKAGVGQGASASGHSATAAGRKHAAGLTEVIHSHQTFASGGVSVPSSAPPLGTVEHHEWEILVADPEQIQESNLDNPAQDPATVAASLASRALHGGRGAGKLRAAAKAIRAAYGLGKAWWE